jgi:hypothetical protein
MELLPPLSTPISSCSLGHWISIRWRAFLGANWLEQPPIKKLSLDCLQWVSIFSSFRSSFSIFSAGILWKY